MAWRPPTEEEKHAFMVKMAKEHKANGMTDRYLASVLGVTKAELQKLLAE